MHETRTNLQRKAANAARAKSERRLVADELKDDASSDDDAHGDKDGDDDDKGDQDDKDDEKDDDDEEENGDVDVGDD